MPIRHPFDCETSYNTEEAALWLTERGLPTSPASLASKRTTGEEGPRWFKLGKPVYYKESGLRAYLLYKLTPEVQSTSELKTARQFLIEDKSQKPEANAGNDEVPETDAGNLDKAR
jgi:hypothetical protein